jgi:membrane protease YdiL (CAAX protease family)
MIIYIIGGQFTVPEIDDIDAWTDAIVNLVLETAVPGLIIASIICIATYLIYKATKKESLDIKHIEGKKATFAIGTGLLLNGIISAFLMGLNFVLELIVPDDLWNLISDTASTNVALSGNFFVILIGTGLLVPIMEEIIFRHGVHKTLLRNDLLVAYAVSSLSFGAAHGNLVQATYATALGFIFAVFVTNTNNLWYPILAHMTINTSSVLMTKAEEFGFPVWASLIIISAIGAFIVFKMHKDSDIKEMCKVSLKKVKPNEPIELKPDEYEIIE